LSERFWIEFAELLFLCWFAGVAGGSIALMATGGQAEPLFMAIQDSMLLKPLAKFTIAFPLSFHLLGGIRHLAWDNIWGHDQETVTATAWGILYGSIGLSALLTLVEFDE
jgi:succinate dehydrogenase/fumarate reductase cytochrome b subunit